MTHYDVVELELDDVCYLLHYSYSPPRPATYWEPASGGVIVEAVDVTLRGGVTLPVADYEKLTDLPRLIELAEAQERERERREEYAA